MKGVLGILTAIIIVGIAIGSFAVLDMIVGDSAKKIKEEKDHWAGHIPASVAKYKMRFVFRADYGSYEEYIIAIAQRVDFLERNGYKVVDINFLMAHDSVADRTLVHKSCVIYYKKKEVKK